MTNPTNLGFEYEGATNAAGQPHGHGRATFGNGSRYEGEFREGVCHGHGTLTNSKGVYVGQMIDGQQHGQGTHTLTSGDVYQGMLENGLCHGHGQFTWKTGAVYMGDFVAGFRMGQGEYRNSKGDVYVGEVAWDSLHGQGTYTYKDGQYYAGGYHDGKRHGHGTFSYIHHNGRSTASDRHGTYRMYVGQWIKTNRHGRGKMTYTNGDTYDGGWRDGNMFGAGTMTFADAGKHRQHGIWESNVFRMPTNVPLSPQPTPRGATGHRGSAASAASGNGGGPFSVGVRTVVMCEVAGTNASFVATITQSTMGQPRAHAQANTDLTTACMEYINQAQMLRDNGLFR